jgi:hypothetical protein
VLPLQKPVEKFLKKLNIDVSSFPRESVIASVMYTVVTLMLNPFIYSLSNRDIKTALRIRYNRIMPKFSIVNIGWIMQKKLNVCTLINPASLVTLVCSWMCLILHHVS